MVLFWIMFSAPAWIWLSTHWWNQPYSLSSSPMHCNVRSDRHRSAIYLWDQQRLSQWVLIFISFTSTHITTQCTLSLVQPQRTQSAWLSPTAPPLRRRLGTSCFARSPALRPTSEWIENVRLNPHWWPPEPPQTVSNTSRGQLAKYIPIILAKCWEACTTPTASALRLKSVEFCSHTQWLIRRATVGWPSRRSAAPPQTPSTCFQTPQLLL